MKYLLCDLLAKYILMRRALGHVHTESFICSLSVLLSDGQYGQNLTVLSLLWGVSDAYAVFLFDRFCNYFVFCGCYELYQ